MPKASPNDHFTKVGAMTLADQITAYWRTRGYPSVRAEHFAIRGEGVWGVRSNLWNGLPRGRGRPRSS